MSGSNLEKGQAAPVPTGTLLKTVLLHGCRFKAHRRESHPYDILSDQDWRERIGNAVPPDATQAIASTMGTTLLLAWSGEGFMLSSIPIWVRPVAVALSVKPQEWGDEA